MSDPIFRLAEREKRRQQQVVVDRTPDVIVGKKTRIGAKAKREGLIPQEAIVTKVTPTGEGTYNIEYYTPKMLEEAQQEAKRKYEEARRTEMEKTITGRIALYGESIEVPDPTGARARGERRYYTDPLEPFRTGEWLGEWKGLVGHVAGFVGAFEGLPAFGEMVVRSIGVTVTTQKPQLVQPEVFKFPPSYQELEKEMQVPYVLGGIWGTIALARVQPIITGKTKAATKYVATKVKDVSVPLWMKKVPEAIYYETGLRGAVKYTSPIITEKAKFLGTVGKEVLREAPFSVFYPLPKLVSKYYGPELAWRISQTTPFMAAKGTFLTGKEYWSAFQVARQTWTPLAQRIQFSTPYMAGRYLKEVALPELASELAHRVSVSMPVMAGRYAGLRAREYWSVLKTIPQTWTPLSLRLELSMPYATAKYLKKYALPELLARTKLGVAGLTYYPSEVFKRAGYEVKWFATKEFPTYIGRGLTRLKYGAMDIGLDYPYRLAKERIPQFLKEQAQIAKWYAKEFGYRGLYETKWFLTKEIPTFAQRIPTYIQSKIGFFPERLRLDVIPRLKMETYYLGELLKRGRFEALYPFKYGVGAVKTRWTGIKYYLEQELYKTPRGLEHLLKEPYRGMQITLGRADLPYRGLMGVIPKGFVVHKTGKGMALLTKQVTKEIVKQPSMLKHFPFLAAPFALQIAKPKVKRKQVPSLVAYTGPRLKSIYEQKKRFHQVAGVILKTYPKEKPKRKEKAIPFGLLRGWELEKFGQPQLPEITEILKQSHLEKQLEEQAQKLEQSLRQELKQIQKQAQSQKQLFASPMMLRLPRTRRKKRRRKGYGEEWFFKLHPLATPKEVFKSFTGSPKKPTQKRVAKRKKTKRHKR